MKNKFGFCLTKAQEKKITLKINAGIQHDYIRICNSEGSEHISEEDKTKVKYVCGMVDALELLSGLEIIHPHQKPEIDQVINSLKMQRAEFYNDYTQQNTFFEGAEDNRRMKKWK